MSLAENMLRLLISNRSVISEEFLDDNGQFDTKTSKIPLKDYGSSVRNRWAGEKPRLVTLSRCSPSTRSSPTIVSSIDDISIRQSDQDVQSLNS